MRKKRYVSFLLLLTLFLTSFCMILNTKEGTLKDHSPAEFSDVELLNFPLTSDWVVNGTSICTEGNNQYIASICTDGYGGAIIAWEDARTGQNNRSIYVQKIGSSGDIQWDINGVPVCTNTSLGIYPTPSPQLCSDGEGGAIITWLDNRSGTGIPDIYAQRVNSTGIPLWTHQGEV